jgi:hypothetical protein
VATVRMSTVWRRDSLRARCLVMHGRMLLISSSACCRSTAICVLRTSRSENALRVFCSPLAGRDVLYMFYSREVLGSVDARVGWVEPDIAALRLELILKEPSIWIVGETVTVVARYSNRPGPTHSSRYRRLRLEPCLRRGIPIAN